jgi:CotH kinase protein/Lamin Tail Domain/Fn3 associated/CHU_C Type IX secretion signal domain
MIGIKKILQTVLFVFLTMLSGYGQIKINEILANNQGALKNSTIQMEDWIELYNSSDDEIDIGGMGISDNDSIKHIFSKSGLKIAGKGYLVLIASGDVSSGNKHLSFSLNDDGETLKLFSASGKVVDRFEYPALRKDVAYGRKFDGATRMRYFAQPSLETTNNDQVAAKKITKAPKFSKKGGFYSSFQLKISRFLSNADIYYTLDGSEPKPHDTLEVKYEFKNNYQENPGDPAVNQKFSGSKKSFFYNGKIGIAEINLGENKYSLIPTTFAKSATYLPKTNIPKAQIVRAIAVKKGKLPSEIVSNTYFLEANKKNPYTFPIVSLAFNPEDLFDYEKGMYVAGNTFDTFRRTSFETTGLCTVGNYTNRTSFWEKDASFEFFENSMQKISQPITGRIHGGCSRSFPYKSFKLFSEDNFDKYDLIRKEKTTKQGSVVLRNSGNDYNGTLFKDVFIHQMVKDLKIPIQEFRPSIVYINGEYWGIHNLRDRVDNDYLNKVYGVDKGNVDMIKVVFDGPEELEYGDMVAFNDLKTFFKGNSFTDATNFEKAKSLIDIDNFIDYQIAHIFVGNIDWPQNNVRLWRVKTNNANNAPNDGKWRWVFFDADRSLGETVNVSHNNLEDAINRSENFIFNKLLQNQTFKKQFMERFTDLLDKNFKYENSLKVFLNIKKLYEPEMENHLKRWNIIQSKTAWEQNCQAVLDYLKMRPDIIREQLKSKLGTNFNEVKILNPFVAELSIDGRLENRSFNVFKQDSSLLNIKPVNSESKKFSHWMIGQKQFFETELQVNITSDTTISAIYENLAHKSAEEIIEKEETISTHFYEISRGISPNDDLKNESFELRLLENKELEYLKIFDKNGLEKPVRIQQAVDTDKMNIIFDNLNNLKSGTYFYVLKLRNHDNIFCDFLTVAN